MEENIVSNSQRDYDKEPIVIKDYNPKIILYVIVSELILWELFFIINPIGIVNSDLLRILLVLPIIVLPTMIEYKKIKDRVFILKNDTIEVKCENNIEIFNINQIKYLKKSFQSYYDKNQCIEGYKKIFWYVFSVILIPLQLTIELQNYLIRKVFFNESNMDSYNSVLLYFNNMFINIFIKDNHTYQEVKLYLQRKTNWNIDEIEKNFQFFYIYNIVSKGE